MEIVPFICYLPNVKFGKPHLIPNEIRWKSSQSNFIFQSGVTDIISFCKFSFVSSGMYWMKPCHVVFSVIKKYPNLYIVSPYIKFYFDMPCKTATVAGCCEALVIEIGIIWIAPKRVYSVIGISITVSKEFQNNALLAMSSCPPECSDVPRLHLFYAQWKLFIIILWRTFLCNIQFLCLVGKILSYSFQEIHS